MFLFNDHSKLEGQHAFLGASTYRWINWNDEIFENRYYGQFSSVVGTLVHDLASQLIKNRIKLNKNDEKLIELKLASANIPKGAYNSKIILENLIPFVNDAIGFFMKSEVILFYSLNCFGTTDAISFNQKQKLLRIHDYKSGLTPAHMEQLLIYAALFFLEYHQKPTEIKVELRIYQNGDIIVYTPDPLEIEKFMHMIIDRDKLIMQYIERDLK